jgi:Tol biopolymer transport system component
MTRLASCLLALLAAAAFPLDAGIGLFESHGGVGVTPKAGEASFDSAGGRYRITGGGENMWRDTDAFHFVWKRLSGDISLSAEVSFPSPGVNAHRKAAIMLRQSLDPGAAYADVALHGDGLTAMQYRPRAGAQTLEMRSTKKGPLRIRIDRTGDQFMMTVGGPDDPEVVGPVTVAMTDPVYAGLAVCSHDPNVLETAVFSNVKIESRPRRIVRSRVSIYDLRSKKASVVFTADKIVEAPNWSPDGRYLLVNSGGNLYRLPLEGAARQLEKIDLGPITGCNNDHGISADGKMLAFSARGTAPGSQVYLAAIDGSNPRLLTPLTPSYFHGFSPDGKWLAYTAQRQGNFDIYRVPTAGGVEERLTSNPGLDDGPDYSRDGKWIYLNSDRTGNFDIWRIPAAGAGPGEAKMEQVTSDGMEDWFPHPSPNGKWMVFVSFEKGTRGHPPNRDVELRLMRMPGDRLKPSRIRTLLKLFGGQGTINVNSWSPDSRRFAFVSYELVGPSASP